MIVNQSAGSVIRQSIGYLYSLTFASALHADVFTKSDYVAFQSKMTKHCSNTLDIGISEDNCAMSALDGLGKVAC